jgi:hypothetical protein
LLKGTLIRSYRIEFFGLTPVVLVCVTHLIFLRVPTASNVVGNFSFRNIDLNECLSAFESIISNAMGVDGVSVKFLKLLLPLICCHVMHVF